MVGSAPGSPRIVDFTFAVVDVDPRGSRSGRGVPVIEIAGADLAERFPSSEDLPPGTVVSIDPVHPGRLRMCRRAYDHAVAGVVSGANGLSAGVVLGSYSRSDKMPAVALSGRVWVHCDATEHAIAPGDLLTTSELAGLAMKAANIDRARGAIIGKAMTPLAQAKRGFVLVLVSLQ